MISKKIQDEINEQINRELFSEYLYFSMENYFASINLDGFQNWFNVQVQEEHFHAIKFVNYLNERGGRVFLKAIQEPQHEFNSPKEIFELSLKHEQFITKSINDLMDIAIKENDHATKSFLQWYVDEQVEEEANFEKILNRIKLINNSPDGIMMLDSQLALRVYTPPTQTAK